jgi:transposase
MKTYKLRTAAVEPQNPRPPALTLHLGLDVHNDSLAVSLAPSDSTEVRRYGIIGGTHEDVRRLITKLQAAHPGATLRFCYEAGPRGFPLCRFLRSLGHECLVVCPARVPRCPGDRVKTDRRDADQLARLLRAGELTGLHVPEPEDEALRDLLRTRQQILQARHRARQQIKMFLLRHNIRYAGTTAWTAKHLRHLGTVKLPFAAQQFALQELIGAVTEAGQRLERFEVQLEREVAAWRWEPVVRALMSLRGVRLLNAAILVAELGDLNRFTRPAQLMSYLGLVPSEHTSGDNRRQGGLTKMGNGHARRALVEAAHQYRAGARISRQLQARQEGLPKGVTDAAWEAQRRLHHRYRALLAARKKAPVVIAALARELSGFVWAIARQVQPHPAKTPPAPPA